MDFKTARKQAAPCGADNLRGADVPAPLQSPRHPRLNIREFHWWNEVSHDVARTGTATVFPHTIAMAAFDPELLEQVADAIFTEDCAKHFAAHSGRTGSVPKSATLKRTGRSGVPRRTPIWQKSEDHRRFQLPPRQPAEPPCRLPCKKPDPPPHHRHRPAASGFLPEPRDLGGNLLPIAQSEALKNPAIQKMAKKYGVTSAQLCIRCALELGAVALPKTANPACMADNAKVDFSISSEGTEALKAMKHIETYDDFDVFPVFSGNPLS